MIGAITDMKVDRQLKLGACSSKTNIDDF